MKPLLLNWEFSQTLMPKSGISPDTIETVSLWADHCCVYCKSQDKYSPHGFTIDHIIPLSLGGTNDLENLAYACFLCNRLKSNKTEAFDNLSEKLVPLFNPRKDSWHQHFAWNEDATLVIGISPGGRATVDVLQLNREKLIEYRRAVMPLGTHPPK